MHNIINDLSPTILVAWLGLITGTCLLGILLSGSLKPFLLKMGARNAVRRPRQALLLVFGLALATGIIVAALGIQDSFNASMAPYRLAQMGNVDESITGTFTQQQIATYQAQIRQQHDVQAISALFYVHGAGGSNVWSSRTGTSLGSLSTYAIPPDFDTVYGPLTDSHGQRIHFADLRPDEVYLSKTLVSSFDVQPGDTLQIQFFFSGVGKFISTSARVRALLPNDLAFTSGELASNNPAGEIILPLATLQRLAAQQLHQDFIVNTICVKNVGSGGMDDIGPAGERSQAVQSALSHIVGVPVLDVNGGLDLDTQFNDVLIHPLKPDMVQRYGVPLSFALRQTSAAQQLRFSIPLLSDLLVGAALLLLVLLFLLLAAERRSELGISRALGLQRGHLIQLLLLEGCIYTLVGGLLGILLGLGIIAALLALLSSVPQLGGASIALHVWVSWQNLGTAYCLGTLVALLAIFLSAIWISSTNIVAAIRNLDEPPTLTARLSQLVLALWLPPRDEAGLVIPETLARQIGRRVEAIGRLLWGLFARGVLSLPLGLYLLQQGMFQEQIWLQHLGITLACAGACLFIAWLLQCIKIPSSFARRLGFTLLGLSWLAFGLYKNILLGFFIDVPGDNEPFLTLDTLLSTLTLVSGAVILAMSNVDLLLHALSALIRRVRGLAPISRTSLAYPLTFRFRTGATIFLLSLVMLLVTFFTTINLVDIQHNQLDTITGGYQLGMTDSRPGLEQQFQSTPELQQQFQRIASLHALLGIIKGNQVALNVPLHLHLPNGDTTLKSLMPTEASDAFLASTQLPFLARAQSYTSDRQVWDTLQNQAGYAVLRYDTDAPGLPTGNGFKPFTVDIPDRTVPQGVHYHPVTIIGILAPDTYYPSLFVSQRTARDLVVGQSGKGKDNITYYTYLFQERNGAQNSQAIGVLNHIFSPGNRRLAFQVLDPSEGNTATAILTLTITGYLGLGLIFGILAIAIIISRAVVERRQQIGMLRALGFSRGLILRSFLLEASIIVTLGLLLGTLLACGLAYQVFTAYSENFPLPILPLLLILLACYLVASLATIFPARQAAHLSPAEALRYE
ncbi:hypothetical protein KSD_64520 [Ktedonobacter sp. SOSP1-85]|uniref:ABC transporter permease n=1 Tax=Ktedonobacter sp. SOSP1-85 TaxID=2778367 RepID=UPI0019160D00|nr:FtsX-like permease family protein [Ktedonobacter sp. SOSP1-85]GHO78681.1 hypothetical protein KSD_64520 [Ktedonobacter sp. SOSP1-85]